jgi:cell shape-determining protein MreC
MAKVVFKPPFSSFNNLILSGSFDQSKVGQKIFYRNIVLGEIFEVKNNTAVVKLFSASGNVTPAELVSGEQFEVHGKGTGRYEMVLPKAIEIEEGDSIVYPHEKIVLFGFVNKVFSTEDDLFNKILFNIPVDFADLNYVRVGEPLDIFE